MKRLLGILCAAFFVFSGAGVAFAADPGPVVLSFTANPSVTLQSGQTFDVDVSVDSSADEINALQGTVSFPTDALDVKEIRDGNSLVNFWIEKPHTSADGIVFAGMIPGGIQEKGHLFTIRFIAKKEGASVVNVVNAQALRNDGKGTAAELKMSPLQLAIGPATGNPPPPPTLVDTDAPEAFRPEIAQDPNAFDGKWFVAFSTTDKGSGIDHYEVKEEREAGSGVWRIETSPFVLDDQSRESVVYVKAVDRNGNERVESMAPLQVPSKIDWRIVLGGVVILGILLAGFFLSRKRRKT